jgi:protein gp37
MSDRSAIEWTDATWNPVTGCTQVSPGCDNCYALRFAERFRGVAGHPFTQGFDLRLWSDRLGVPLTWKRPRRIFVNSMSDLFHRDVPEAFIAQVFETMAAAHWHTFQLLTKRSRRAARLAERLPWASNVWMGVSVESEQYTWRVDHLREIPAAVRFISAEPLLGTLGDVSLEGIHWVITGGESGSRHRPCEVEWVRSIRDLCVSRGVAYFHKQWGGRTPKSGGRELDGRVWDEFPRIAGENGSVSPRRRERRVR